MCRNLDLYDEAQHLQFNKLHTETTITRTFVNGYYNCPKSELIEPNRVLSYFVSGIDAIIRGEYSGKYLVIFAPNLYKENGSVSVNLDFQIWGAVLY